MPLDELPSVSAIQANVASIRRRIAAAAERSGRGAGDVRLVAVTKSEDPVVIPILAAAGVLDVGENRPAALVERRDAFSAAVAGDPKAPTGPIRWHLIGHWQRNKVRRALPAVDLFHALDSEELAGVLDAETRRVRGPAARLRVLVQVNVSGEGTKGGFPPDSLGRVLPVLQALPALRLDGLMTMAPETDDPERVRPVFRCLRELRDWATGLGYLEGSELSMGMSGDFEAAVEEGSTAVRIGRALFTPMPSSGA